ncbi:hypothetical protein CRENBAI_011644, partial [Crenichthys baileyi]
MEDVEMFRVLVGQRVTVGAHWARKDPTHTVFERSPAKTRSPSLEGRQHRPHHRVSPCGQRTERAAQLSALKLTLLFRDRTSTYSPEATELEISTDNHATEASSGEEEVPRGVFIYSPSLATKRTFMTEIPGIRRPEISTLPIE